MANILKSWRPKRARERPQPVNQSWLQNPFGESGSRGASPENRHYDPKYAKLYHAVRTGNLEATKEFLENDPRAVRARISKEGQRPLHVAALFGHLEIVEELLQRMPEKDVALQDDNELTALHEAIYGGIDVAECLIKKNGNLLEIPENSNLLPITRAFGFGQTKMARYLYPLTPLAALRPEQGKHGATLLYLCWYSGMLGIDIPREQLRTFNREVHETIPVDMPETSTSQSEERITTKKKSNSNTMAFFGEFMD